MICKYCGKENPEGARFCNFCGNRLDDELPIMNDANEEQHARKLPSVVEQSYAPGELVPEDTDILEEDDLKEEYSFSDYLKENKKTPVVFAIALFLLLAIVLMCTGR